MTKKANIDITAEHLALIQAILAKHLPKNTSVWAFSSRTKHNARKFSDLDLAIDAQQPLSHHILLDLASDFEESSLPYKVDLIDWKTTAESFKKIIAAQRIKLIENNIIKK